MVVIVFENESGKLSFYDISLCTHALANSHEVLQGMLIKRISLNYRGTGSVTLLI